MYLKKDPNQNIFYVYEHLTRDGKVFYVGKGSGKRAHDRSGRNKIWKSIANQGYNVRIVQDHLTNDEAMFLEKSLWEAYKNEGMCEANIYNCGSHKGAPLGIKRSLETRLKVAAASTGHTHNRNRVHTPESRQRMAQASKFRNDAEFHRAVIEKAVSKRRKPVFDDLGNWYPSLTAAAESIGQSYSNIHASIKHGWKAGGRIFRRA